MIRSLKQICERFPNHTPVTLGGVPLADCEAVRVGESVDIRPVQKTKKTKPEKPHGD